MKKWKIVVIKYSINYFIISYNIQGLVWLVWLSVPATRLDLDVCWINPNLIESRLPTGAIPDWSRQMGNHDIKT